LSAKQKCAEFDVVKLATEVIELGLGTLCLNTRISEKIAFNQDNNMRYLKRACVIVTSV
jgi:hypothetical protein